MTSRHPPNPNKAPKYGIGQKHLFQFFGENEREWTGLGWTVVGLSLVSTLLFKLDLPFVAPPKPDMKNLLMGLKPIHTPFAVATMVFFLTMVFSSVVWVSFDLIDRRGRAIWMVPMTICGFLCLPSLPMALYMFAGRRE